MDTSKHHVILTKGIKNDLTDTFDRIAEGDKDFRRIWDHQKKSGNFFMHIDAAGELDEEYARLLANSMKNTYAIIKEKILKERAARKNKREKFNRAKKTNSSTH